MDSAEPIATTAAAPLCRLVRRAPTRIEAVRNLGCDTASTLVSATKMMRFKKMTCVERSALTGIRSNAGRLRAAPH